MGCTYYVANVLICLNVFVPFAIGSFTFIFRHVIDGTRVVAIVPDVKTMSGATFYPLIMMLLMSIDTLWFS